MNNTPNPPALNTANLGPPLQLAEINVDGIAMNVALSGDTVEMLTRLGVTSEEYFFHRAAAGLAKIIESAAGAAGHTVCIASGRMVLVVVKADKTADLYFDTAAVSIGARLKQAVKGGAPIFENDLLDVSTMSFPCVEMRDDDQVIIFLSDGWRHGLYFDLTRNLDRSLMEKTLGSLSRSLRFYDKYAALSDAAVFGPLITAGWFPFLELSTDEFTSLYSAVLTRDDVAKCGKALLGNFPARRIQAIADRWKVNQHFAKREVILTSGIEAFIRGDPVAAIKTLLSEIEGILRDAHISANNKDANTGGLIKFAVEAGSNKTNDDNSLFFPREFQRYLSENTYANFDPIAGRVSASRHGVSHSAAAAETYTQVRALQVILTLDQIFFYL